MQYFINKTKNHNLNRAELFQCLDFLMDLTLEKNFLKYNEILCQINVSLISTTLIIGLLRVPFLYKNEIIEWEKFLLKAKDELVKRNLDENILLKGLL